MKTPYLRRPTRAPSLLIATFACVLMQACGGGGGSSAGDSDNPGTVVDCNAWPSFTPLHGSSGNSEILSASASGHCAVIIAGYDNSSKAGHPEGNAAGFVRALALESTGELSESWAYSLDTEATDFIGTIEVTGSELVFTGSTTGELDGQQSAGKSDLVLGSLSASGEVLKISQLGNEKPNFPLALITLPDRSWLLIGYDDIYVPTNYVESWEDPWVAGISASADQYKLDWIQNAYTSESDRHTAAVLADYLVVSALHTGSGPRQGIALEARTETGVLVWSFQLSPSPYDTIAALHYLGNDELLVFGTSYIALADTVQGNGDYFLLKLNLQSREVQWLRQFGDGDINWARSITVVDDAIFVAGESSPEMESWRSDVYQFSLEGEQSGKASKIFGLSTSVRQILPLGDGLLMVGSYEPDTNSRQGYLAFLPSRNL